MEETSAASDAANAPNPYGSGAPEEEKRSLTGTALARTKITTEREKRLVKSDLFEPLLANLLAFVKAFQRKYKIEHLPPPKPGREPIKIPQEVVNQINHDHAIAQKHLSRSYLTIIIEFSSHSQLLADQKFFRWLHKMLCQFIDQSTEKGDKELEEAVQLELHRLFQGDRFNVEAKKPEQILRIHKKRIRPWKLNRMNPMTLGKEMQRNSPVVSTILPSPSEKITAMLKEIEVYKNAPIPAARPQTAMGHTSTPAPRGKINRPSTATPSWAIRTATAGPRPVSSPGKPRLQYDVIMKTYDIDPGTRSLLDVRLSGSLALKEQKKAEVVPLPRRGEDKKFVRKIEYDSDWLVRERAKPPCEPDTTQTAASGSHEARTMALALLEKKPFGCKQVTKWTKWQSF